MPKAIAYECPNGCCRVRVLFALKRGEAAQMWLNDDPGTFRSWGRAYELSDEAVLAKVKRHRCMYKYKRSGKEFRMTKLKMQELARKFLSLPRVTYGEEEARA